MKIFIRAVSAPSGIELLRIHYPNNNESEINNLFAALTTSKEGPSGRLQWDLIVEHPEQGLIVRNTAFTHNSCLNPVSTP